MQDLFALTLQPPPTVTFTCQNPTSAAAASAASAVTAAASINDGIRSCLDSASCSSSITCASTAPTQLGNIILARAAGVTTPFTRLRHALIAFLIIIIHPFDVTHFDGLLLPAGSCDDALLAG